MMMAMVAEVVEQEELAVVGIVLVVEMVNLDRGLSGWMCLLSSSPPSGRDPVFFCRKT